eukprot:94981-Chlamydomonas_euryale.AAC.3
MGGWLEMGGRMGDVMGDGRRRVGAGALRLGGRSSAVAHANLEQAARQDRVGLGGWNIASEKTCHRRRAEARSARQRHATRPYERTRCCPRPHTPQASQPHAPC